MRLTSFCLSAPRLPIVIESAASTHISIPQRCSITGKPEKVILSKTANAAALGAVDIRPTTGAGAPWYTSGVHTWNGAAETLKPSPTIIIASARKAMRGVALPPSPAAIAAMLVDPVAPNASATPYRKNAVANEPSRKYLMDDSEPDACPLRNPAMMYVEMEEISSPMKTIRSSTEQVISIMPTAPNRTSAKYSPACPA